MLTTTEIRCIPVDIFDGMCKFGYVRGAEYFESGVKEESFVVLVGLSDGSLSVWSVKSDLLDTLRLFEDLKGTRNHSGNLLDFQIWRLVA